MCLRIFRVNSGEGSRLKPLKTEACREQHLKKHARELFVADLLNALAVLGLASRDGGVVHQAQHPGLPQVGGEHGLLRYVLGPCSLQMPTCHRTMALQWNSCALLDDHDPSHMPAVVLCCLPVRNVSCCRLKPGFVSVGVRV